MSLLKVTDLKVSYGGIEALKGVSFAVKEGEIVTLIGANGAGKSTALRSISGLVSVKGGTIEFAGEDITGMDPQKIVYRGIAMVPEGRRVFPNLTVAENLKIGAYLRKDEAGIRKDMDHVYDLFPRLKEREKQVAGTLSGGEQQMLAMGRALMGRPKLLMLDEPSMGLAPKLVDQIFDIIAELHAAGTTILLVEQNALMALHVASRGYVLETGRITLADDANKLLNDNSVKAAYLGG